MAYCIGLTGTVASGKSAAIAYFKTLEIDTFSADDIARQLTQKGMPSLIQIAQHFGQDILTKQGELERRKLRHYILQHPTERLWLENLLHPLIRQEIEIRVKQCQSPYCVIEIPLLDSRINYPYINRILLITAEYQQQINRLMARDHCTQAEAATLLSHQKNTNKHSQIADDILLNSGSLVSFHQELNMLHQHYLNAAKRAE